MESSPSDPCFLLKTENNVLIGIVVLQVDDSAVGGTSEFRELEESASKIFQTKSSTSISTKSHYFNGVKTSCNSHSVYSLPQERRLDMPANVSFSEFAPHFAQVAYISDWTRPNMLAQANILSQVTKETMGDADVGCLRNICSKAVQERSMNFVPFNPSRVGIAVFVDAGFGSNKEYSSQVGGISGLRDPVKANTNAFNIASCKAKRVARSALAAEKLAILDAFDTDFVLKHNTQKMLNREVKLILYTDARSLYHIVISLALVPS
jgi:hypothetical protein